MANANNSIKNNRKLTDKIRERYQNARNITRPSPQTSLAHLVNVPYTEPSEDFKRYIRLQKRKFTILVSIFGGSSFLTAAWVVYAVFF